MSKKEFYNLGLLGWSYKSGEDPHLLLKTYIHKCEPAKGGLANHSLLSLRVRKRRA